MQFSLWGPYAFLRSNVALAIMLLGITFQTTNVIAQSPGTFTPTGSMSVGRTFHTATLLTNGKVLLAGGYFVPRPLLVWASAELYDPSTGTFTTTGNMTTGRYFHTATLLPDGKVLIAGGNNSIDGGCFCSPLASAELYDPSTGTFTAIGDMTTARSAHTATLLHNGKVLMAGGPINSSLANAELYDPSTATFTATGTMTTARARHTATLLNNGNVLIDSGHDDSELKSAELYHPDSGTFSLTGKTTSTAGLQATTATLLTDGNVLATLAYCCDLIATEAEVYDSSTGRFTATGKTIKARGYSTGTLLPDGNVLIAGRDGNHVGGSAELYDRVTGTFSNAGDMTTQREEGHTSTLLPDGRVLMSGGWVCCGYSIATAELYRPAVLKAAPVLLPLSQDGRGPGAVLNASTHLVISPSNPAVARETLEIYLLGLTEGSLIPPQVAIGGRITEIVFFGKAPGYFGLNQVNVRVPSSVARGPAIPVRLTYLGRPSNEVTIAVR